MKNLFDITIKDESDNGSSFDDFFDDQQALIPRQPRAGDKSDLLSDNEGPPLMEKQLEGDENDSSDYNDKKIVIIIKLVFVIKRQRHFLCTFSVALLNKICLIGRESISISFCVDYLFSHIGYGLLGSMRLILNTSNLYF
jgi:hypothetical protein